MKKISLLTSALMMSFSLIGCGGNEKDAPEIVVESVSGTDTVTISGRVKDESKIVGMKVNNIDVVLSGEDKKAHFSVSVPRSDSYTLEAMDGAKAQNTVSMKIVHNNKEFTPGLSVHIPRSGIDFIENSSEDILNNFDIQGLIGTDKIDIGGFAFYASTDANDYNIANPNVSIELYTSSDNKTHAKVEAYVQDIKLALTGTANVVLSAGSATIKSDIIIDANGKFSIVESVPGLIDVTLTDIDVDGNFLIDLAGIIFEDDIRIYAEDMLAQGTSTYINTELEKTLGDLAYSKQNFLLNAGLLDLHTYPSSLKVNNGGLDLTVDTKFKATSAQNSVNRALGSLYLNTVPPIVTSTPNGESFDMSSVISSDILNQALLAAYESGSTNVNLEANGLEFTNIQGNSNDEISDNDIVQYRVIPQGPAQIAMTSDADTMANITLNNFKFELYRKKAGQSDFTKEFTSTIDTLMHINMGINGKNLSVSIIGKPTVTVLSYDKGNGSNKWSTEYANNIVKLLLPIALPKLNDSISTISVPSYYGYSLDVVDVWVMADNANLAIAGALVADAISTTPSPKAPFSTLDFSSYAYDTVDLAFNLSSSNSIEYSYQVDGRKMSPWSLNNTARVSGLEIGLHKVVICTRFEFDQASNQCTAKDFSL